MDRHKYAQNLIGRWVLAGMLAAGVVGVSVTATTSQHVHCTGQGCQNVDCEEEHPGFECHVTDDDVCNCIDPPPPMEE